MLPSKIEGLPVPEKISAGTFNILEKNGVIDASKVKVEYTNFPDPEDVYVCGSLKTTYVHSVWIGVVITVINAPSMLWRLALKPFGMGLVAFCTWFFLSNWFGLRGKIAGILVDRDSFMKEYSTKMAERLSKQLGLHFQQMQVHAQQQQQEEQLQKKNDDLDWPQINQDKN